MRCAIRTLRNVHQSLRILRSGDRICLSADWRLVIPAADLTIPVRRITTNVGVWVVFSALFLSQLLFAQTPSIPSSGKESVLLTAEGKVEMAAAGSTTWSAAQTNQL